MEKENSIEYFLSGKYHSSICIGQGSKVMYSGFSERRHLKDKDDLVIFDYAKEGEPTGWFSDDNVFFLMQNLQKNSIIEKLEFFYEGRRTRLYEKPDLTEGYMFDDWRNCADEEFEECLTKKQSK